MMLQLSPVDMANALRACIVRGAGGGRGSSGWSFGREGIGLDLSTLPGLLLLSRPKTALQRSECRTVLVALRSSQDISAVVSDILRRIFSCFHTCKKHRDVMIQRQENDLTPWTENSFALSHLHLPGRADLFPILYD